MRVDNRTHWRTDQIRAILKRCAEMELEPKKRVRLKVAIGYRERGGGSSGCAYVGGRWCMVRVSSDVFNARDFAQVACHEFAHIRGMRHRDMPNYYIRPHVRRGGNDKTHPRYDWANGIVVERVRKSKPSADERLLAKHEAAIRGLKKALTRHRRATTLLKKWHRRVRGYQKKLAAKTADGGSRGHQTEAG